MLGEKLSTTRKQRGLTADALAKFCDVSRSYITLIESGKRLPGVKIMPKLAAALDLKTSDILNWYLEDMRHRMHKNIERETQANN